MRWNPVSSAHERGADSCDRSLDSFPSDCLTKQHTIFVASASIVTYASLYQDLARSETHEPCLGRRRTDHEGRLDHGTARLTEDRSGCLRDRDAGSAPFQW